MADVTNPRGVASLTAEELEFRDDAALAALSKLAGNLDPVDDAKRAYQYADAMLGCPHERRGATAMTPHGPFHPQPDNNLIMFATLLCVLGVMVALT